MHLAFNGVHCLFLKQVKIMPTKKRSTSPQPRKSTTFCEMCGEQSMRSSCYCPGCREFIHNKPEDSARAEAMKGAFDKARKCFISQITDIRLELKDHNSPNFL